MTRGPIYRSVLVVDVERSTQRPDPIKAELRRETYRIIQAALQAAGIGMRHCDPFVDRGDGVLVLVRPVDDVPKTRLLHPFIPVLTRLLIDRNANLPDAERAGRELRLRAVIHCGEVHCDRNGPFGETLDVACRLVDASALKRHLAHSAAPLALVVSDEIYRSIVRHGYEGIWPDTFIPALRVLVSGRRRRGWIQVPECVILTGGRNGSQPAA